MKPPRFATQKQPTRQSFTKWIQPDMRKYLLACCDCGLVHEMQFRVVRGEIVQFRARQSVGHTKRLRKS